MNIIVADDETLLRDAIQELISRDAPDFNVNICGSLGDVHKILKEEIRIDLVLLDLYMPGMQGISGAVDLATRFPDTSIVLMSGSASVTDLSRAFNSNVHGFISKGIAGKALVAALRLILCGERYFPAQVLQVGEPRSAITERERMILKQLQVGATNKSIAQSLGLDESTVKSTIRTAGRKLGCRTRTEIALKAARLIELEK